MGRFRDGGGARPKEIIHFRSVEGKGPGSGLRWTDEGLMVWGDLVLKPVLHHQDPVVRHALGSRMKEVRAPRSAPGAVADTLVRSTGLRGPSVPQAEALDRPGHRRSGYRPVHAGGGFRNGRPSHGIVPGSRAAGAGEKVREVVPLLAGLDAGLRDTVLKAMLVFLYERVTLRGWAHVAEVIGAMGLPSKLWEDMYNKGWAEGAAKGEAEGEARGEARGRAEGRRADVLDAFEVRFAAVPAAVRQAVSAEKNEARLAAWHRGIIRATDLSEAVRMVIGG